MSGHADGYLHFCATHGKKAFTKPGAKRAIRQLRERGGMREYRCDIVPDVWHIGHLPQAARVGLKTSGEVYGDRVLLDPRDTSDDTDPRTSQGAR
jgi:hypothetical protein